MSMTDPKALFVHELGDILYAERLLVRTLPRLVEEASDGELRRGFEHHLEETGSRSETSRERVPEASA